MNRTLDLRRLDQAPKKRKPTITYATSRPSQYQPGDLVDVGGRTMRVSRVVEEEGLLVLAELRFWQRQGFGVFVALLLLGLAVAVSYFTTGRLAP